MRYVYFGTYTQLEPEKPHRREGIYVYRMTSSSGRLDFASVAMDVHNPSFLALHPDRRFLYSVNEMEEGSVSAFLVNSRNGALNYLNRQPTYGAAPCYLSFDSSGKWLLAANYGGGSLTVLPVLKDGQLGPPSDLVQHYGNSTNTERQEAAHAHSIICDPSGRFVLAADLGMDRILIYRLDAQRGKLILHDRWSGRVKPGSGPRHMAFHLAGRFLYSANELSSTVSVYTWNDKKGLLTPIQNLSTLPKNYTGSNFVADVHLTSSGKYLYVSNRGHDSLACFGVNDEYGYLTPMGHFLTLGKWPRNFSIDPSDTFLLVANQNSNQIVTFLIEASTGKLVSTRQAASIPSPVCIRIVDL